MHKGVHDHLTKLMFTDATVAALLEPRSCDLHHTHVCAGSPQEAISFWKRQQDLLVFATHAYVCMRQTTSCHHQTQQCHQICTRRKCSFQASDLQNTLMSAGTSISARSTTTSLQLTSLVLGLLQHTCVCALTSQAHKFWQLISQFLAKRQAGQAKLVLLLTVVYTWSFKQVDVH